jgi:methionine-S-sulfoxide reductase
LKQGEDKGMIIKALLILNVAFLFYSPMSLGDTKKADAEKTETAIVAGGCFWGMEEVYRKVPGVVSTQVGYAGGTKQNPKYGEVSSGKTGHAESIEVKFDPKKISYEEILKYFFRMHDPTTMNRQGNDVGTQYRSEIFTMNEEQKKMAMKVIKQVDLSKKWPKPVVTKVSAAPKFYPAEEYHQKYLVKNPDGYNDHFLRNFDFK